MNNSIDELVVIAQDIRRLLVALLLKNGVSQTAIAKALGVNQATVSRLLSASRPTNRATKRRR